MVFNLSICIKIIIYYIFILKYYSKIWNFSRIWNNFPEFGKIDVFLKEFL